MARFALIKAGIVERVIVATPEFFSAVPDFADGYVVREVTYPGETPVTGDAIESRDCEPGATWTGAAFVRSAAPIERTREEQIEDRIAALEAAERTR